MLRHTLTITSICAMVLFTTLGCEPTHEAPPPPPPPEQAGRASEPAPGEPTPDVRNGRDEHVPTEAAAPTQFVEVSLREMEIDMPTTLPPGPTTLRITNAGRFPHNVRIVGEGVDATLERDLEPGETQTLDVHLTPGEYHVLCPVSDHADQGMWVEIRVLDEENETQP